MFFFFIFNFKISQISSTKSSISIEPNLFTIPISEIKFQNNQICNLENYSIEKAIWNGLNVSVKKSIEKDLKHEALILSKTSHPRIIQFLGIVNNDLIFENVDQNLASFCKAKLQWSQKTNITLQIAQGMSYLHSRNITHGNLKSENIFLTNNGDVKLSDFGIEKNGKKTKESDLFDFGNVCFQIATGGLPINSKMK